MKPLSQIPEEERRKYEASAGGACSGHGIHPVDQCNQAEDVTTVVGIVSNEGTKVAMALAEMEGELLRLRELVATYSARVSDLVNVVKNKSKTVEAQSQMLEAKAKIIADLHTDRNQLRKEAAARPLPIISVTAKVSGTQYQLRVLGITGFWAGSPNRDGVAIEVDYPFPFATPLSR